MALNTPEIPLRPSPIPLFRFTSNTGGDTHRREATEKVFEYWKRAQGEVHPNHLRLPRLVVRDHCGRKIDIYTSYQEKIYEARRNVKMSGEAKTPEEWRLPHGPPPAKPDYSRVGPPVPINRPTTDEVENSNSLYRQQPFTADVEDVSFIAESIRCLPDVASLSYLRHEFLAGNKLFLPILKACILHERLLSALDRREQQYHIPDLCTGCIRSGLCYGCDKMVKIHHHMDKIAKTGGGFTYYKRDRPGNLLEGKDPRNWSSRFRREFQELAKQMAALGSPAEDEENKMNEKRPLSLIPDFSRQPALPEISDLGLGTDEDAGTPGLHSANEANQINVAPGEVSMDDLLQQQGVPKLIEAPSTAQDSGMDDSSVCARLSEVADLQNVIPQGFGPEVFSYQGWVTENEEFPKGDNQDDEKREGRLPLYLQQRLPKCSNEGETFPGLDGTSMKVNQSFDGLNVEEHKNMEIERSGSEQFSDGKDGQLPTRERQRLYRGPEENAPPAFKLKPREKREIVSRSPFSTNRRLDVPTGEGFTVKKSNRKLTEFAEFKQSGQNWKEPRKFELQQSERNTTEFWSPPTRGEKNKPHKRLPNKPKPASPVILDNPMVSPDSGLESEQFQEQSSEITTDTKEVGEKGDNQDDATNSKLPPLESPPKSAVNEDTSKDTCQTETETVKDSSTDDIHPPEPPAPATPKKPVLKRKKKGVVRIPVRPPSPKLPEIKQPSSVKPLSDDSVKSLTPPSSQSDLSPLPPIEVPELPDFIFPESKPKQHKVKTMIAPPSPVVTKEVKKTRKPPPKARKQVKIKHAKRSVAEAPVTREELQQATDPLDFLAKYCIIHKDRLPLYQRVFQKSVSQQLPRYQRETTPPVSGRDEDAPNTAISKALNDGGELSDGIRDNAGEQPQYVPQLSPHEMKMLHDLTVINRAPSVMMTGVSPAEEYLDKLKFSFEVLHNKQIRLKQQLKELNARRLNVIATKAKELFPDLLASNSEKKAKKKSGKKSGKKSSQSRQSKEVIFSETSSPVEDKAPETPTPPVLDRNSDAGIVQGLSNKAFEAVCATSDVVRVEVEIERGEEKLENVIARMEELQAETSIVKLYCMEYFFQSEMQMAKPKDFMRQQSGLYNSLHPTPDTEMNISEVGSALQMINNNLLTDKEMEYLFHVLNLPGRTRINFQLFSVLAALSERVAQLDPLIKKLINKLNYEALDVKMEKCKELFALLHDGEYLPGGRASASALAVELTAGGLTPEHTAYVLSKFNRDGSGIIDFMDFVTYVPLFIEIHQRIVEDPLRVDLDL